MIPAKALTPKEFAQRYPPGVSVNGSHGGCSRMDIQPCGEDILNDIPPNTTSCLVYQVDILRTFRKDDTYPIPRGAEFQQLRALKSLRAVVKETSPGISVFSHMLISPEDVMAIFGDDFMEEMKAIQRDVISTCVCWLTE